MTLEPLLHDEDQALAGTARVAERALKNASGLYVAFFMAWKSAKCSRLLLWMSSLTCGSSTRARKRCAILAFRLLTKSLVAWYTACALQPSGSVRYSTCDEHRMRAHYCAQQPAKREAAGEALADDRC